MPRVTVFMSLFNAAEHLEKALQSLSSQTFQDFEIIAVDDYSKDDTLAILEDYPDPRLSFFRNDREKGIVGASNCAFEKATGEFIARMDGDDISFPYRLEKQVRFFDEHPDVSVLGGAMEIFGDQEGVRKMPEYDAAIKAEMIFTPGVANPTSMFRSSLFDVLEEPLRYEETGFEDWDFWYRALPFVKFANLQKPLIKYRMHNSSYSSGIRESRRPRLMKFYKNIIEDLNGNATPENQELHSTMTDWVKLKEPLSLYRDYRNHILTSMPKDGLWDVNEVEAAFERRWIRLFFLLADRQDWKTLKEYRKISKLSSKQWYYLLRKRL